MPAITIYGGAWTIGGNKILLEDGDTRLFFDFGTPFAERGRYFEEYLKPRPGAGLLDPLEMGLLPPLEGLYRPDLLPPGEVWERRRGRPGYRELEGVDGVLVSHAHLDHTGYISFLRGETPIYSSVLTAFIAKAVQDSGQTDIESEVCYFSPRAPEEGYLKTGQPGGYRQRPFCFIDGDGPPPEALEFWIQSPAQRKGLEPGPLIPTRPSRVGKLRVRFFPVDHSVYGAGAWAVETSAGWVVYSGDIRCHGARARDTERFIQETASLRPRVLLCEGTRVPREAGDEGGGSYTEEDVLERALRWVRGERGLVVADFGPRNIERLETFLRIAEATGRQLVVLARDAYLLEAVRLVAPQVPGLSSSRRLLVYRDLRSGLDAWQRALLSRFADRLVGPREIHRAPGEFILCFSFWDLKNLIDINVRGGSFLYSSSEAYTEEQELDFQRLRQWLRHFEMRSAGLPHRRGQRIEDLPEEEQGLHASGHASAEELMAFVRAIEPRTVVPVHTENPWYFQERLHGTGIEVRVLAQAEAFLF